MKFTINDFILLIGWVLMLIPIYIFNNLIGIFAIGVSLVLLSVLTSGHGEDD